MKYPAVAACENEFPVSRLCEVLEVSESGYYAWLNRPVSQREQANRSLGERMQAIWQRFRGIYGAPRIHAQLQAKGEVVGHNRVARIMQQLGLRGKGSRRRQPRTTQSNPDHRFEPNVLQQHFDTAQPDAVWLTDITYIPTDEGYLYVAGVMDLYTRQIVGLSMASHLPSELTEAALHMALTQRQPSGPLIHHSDRGSQYTSDDYRNLLRAHPIVEGRKQSVEGITFSFEFDHLRADEDIEFSCHGLPQHK
ncbi:MAG: IS3 family transposase [Anaerolineae bacterium]|jgi:transposase InsO family protein|nr:IS3 family transposase [Chloroflexota bacterium]MBN8617460.1 IS3 family transposase [Anaerolineae bacterium]HUN10528.1 IS3 family transposase [Aggregatilineales bacterium]